MSQTATLDAPAAVSPEKDAVEYLRALLQQQTVHDRASGQTVPDPVEKVELAPGLKRSETGTPKESLSVVMTLSDAAKLELPQVLERADAVLRTVPVLADHFSFGADVATPEKPHPVAHAWNKDHEKLVVTFNLPASVDSARIIEDINKMKMHGTAAPAAIESAHAAPAQEALAPAQPAAPVASQADTPLPATPATAPVLTSDRPVVGSGSYTSGFSTTPGQYGPVGKFR